MKRLLALMLALALALGVCGAMAEASGLPPYSYPFADEEPILAAVANYMVTAEEFGYTPEEGGVLIPAPIVLKMDVNEDETQAKVYGNFWLFAYKLEGKILMCTAGGECPGVMQLEKKDGAWAVTSLEVAEDGEAFEASIKKLAGGDEALEKEYAVSSDATEGYLPQYRRAFVLAYAQANELDIEAFQDYGWDPVSITD